MDGHARTAGKLFVPVMINGKEYRLSQPRLGVMAEMEAWLLAMVSNPIRLALEATRGESKEVRDEALSHAYAESKRSLKPQEYDRLGETPRGMIVILWGMFQEHHAAEFPTPHAIQDWLNEVDPEQLQELMATIPVASGEDDAKNLSGPTPSGSGETPSQKSPDGPPSTVSSDKSSDTAPIK